MSRLADFAALPAETLWLRPIGLLRGGTAEKAVASGAALPLAGGPLAFPFIELLALRDHELVSGIASVAELRQEAAHWEKAQASRIAELLATLSAKRADWAGLSLERPLIMGVLNVTPDSFSDGGDFHDPGVAIAHGRAMMEAGADLIDIGGESTRPGAAPVSPAEEIARVETVIAELAAAGALISIDTRHAVVMEAALAKGAKIVNDVTALTGDPASRAAVAKSGAPVILMHMRGEPRTMQRAPTYDDAPIEITEFLAARIAECAAAGIERRRIVVDPGIGFGKDKGHNLEVLDRVTLLHALGCGILLGMSRKSLIGRVTNAVAPKDRLPGSLAGALHGIAHGVQIVRVHDVAETRQAIRVAQAIAEAT
ncbi:MAG: dihydropteroate synthase [Alphaproteobacteria bacterium]|nr:dihydropteroate synthase [Alphaproteobacteria bacterium]